MDARSPSDPFAGCQRSRSSRELCPLPEPGDNWPRASTFLMRTGEGTDAFLGRRAMPGTAAPQWPSPDRCLVQGHSPLTRAGKPKSENRSRDSIHHHAAGEAANGGVLPLDNRGPYRCWAASNSKHGQTQSEKRSARGFRHVGKLEVISRVPTPQPRCAQIGTLPAVAFIGGVVPDPIR